MVFSLLVALAAAPPTLAMPGLNGVNLSANEVQLYAELLANELSQGGLKVLTARDISLVLGFDRQRQLLGCAESACTAELAQALGVDALVTGDVGHLGDAYVLNLKVLSAKNAEAIALFRGELAASSEFPALMKRAAVSLANQLAQAWGRPELSRVEAHAPPTARRWWALAPAAVGLGAIIAGVALERQADDDLRRLQTLPATATVAEAGALRTTGKQDEAFGAVGLIAGGAAIVTGGVLFALLGPGAPEAAVAVTPSGAFVSVQGRFP